MGIRRFVPISIAALAGAGSREAGLQSGLINTMQQFGGAVGLAILNTVATTRMSDLLVCGTARGERALRRFRGLIHTPGAEKRL